MNTSIAPRFLSRFFDDDSFAFPEGWLAERASALRSIKPIEMPAVNIKEGPQGFELELAVPGFKKDELKVGVADGVLTVSSERKEEKGEANKDWRRREFSYASFTRSFQLPEQADADSVKARFADGVLHLSVSKAQPQPVRKGREVPIG